MQEERDAAAGVAEVRPRYGAHPRIRQQVTEPFLDVATLMETLAPDVTLWPTAEATRARHCAPSRAARRPRACRRATPPTRPRGLDVRDSPPSSDGADGDDIPVDQAVGHGRTEHRRASAAEWVTAR